MTQTKLCLFALLLAGCTHRASDCRDNALCPSEGGAGGESGGESGGNSSSASSGGGASKGGASKGGASKGGSSSAEGGSGGATQGSTQSAPCNATCGGATPVCDVATNTCVGCLASTDCKAPGKPICGATNTCITCAGPSDCTLDAAKPTCDTSVPGGVCVGCVASTDCKDPTKPVCDATTKSCVGCLDNATCTDASKSLCDAATHQCAPCKEDTDCTQIPGKGVCDGGTCVQCTVAKEGACGGKSCDPKKKECTETQRGSRNACESCVADSECMGGELTEPTARCVPMVYGAEGEKRGEYCLQRRESAPCTQPFAVLLDAESVSGAAVEQYCGINQILTTCEAVRDLIGSKPCTVEDGVAECGGGVGGLCKRSAATDDLRCTIQCGKDDQCPSGNTCSTPAKPWCQ